MIARLCLFAAVVLGLAAGGLRGGEPQAEPVSPREVVRLFNGHDLTGLSTWLKDTKHDDPRRVFRVTDGVLHITGDGFGYVATEKEYRDYHLVVEYKWGKRTDGGKYVRNSGILLNAIGPGRRRRRYVDGVDRVPARPGLRRRPDRHPRQGRERRDDPRAAHERDGPGARQAAALEEGRRAAGLHQQAALVVAARSRFQGTARHPGQERRREPAGRVDPGRLPVRRATGSRCASTGPRSTSVTTSSPRPARSCCSPRGSSCSCGSLNCTR